ncbi:MAG: hypothetical protein IJ242_11875 [Clostridia bacterium]|nr:hypothetical protein [Clostridia bacterium]
MKKEYRKYWLFGIIGAICFGIGDWLLGYVDPGIVNENFAVIKAGHGAGYDLSKITITLLFGAIGVPFLMLGCAKMTELVTTGKKIFHFWMILLPVGWLIIHFTVSISIYVYAWGAQAGLDGVGGMLAMDILRMMKPAQIVSYFFAGIPLVMLLICALSGKTVLKKKSQIFTPILWMALLSGLKFVVSATPFTIGIDTFCMNAGVIIWFVYLMLQKAE